MTPSLEGLKSIVYAGRSMYPLLKDLDLLFYAPCEAGHLKVGDVIVFISGKTIITHRVISIERSGIVTRGDNNLAADEGFLAPEKVIGQAVYAKRGSRLIKIRGGLRGRLFSYAARLRLIMEQLLTGIMVWPYHAASKAGVFRIFLPKNMRPRVVSFRQAGGTESRLLMGKRVIGKLRSQDTKWTIYPPYKLFVNEEALPIINSSSVDKNDHAAIRN